MNSGKIVRGMGRESNLELYRIVTMLLIIAHHYTVNSGVLDKAYENPLSANSIFLFLFGAWGKTGINCFLMITGYFMCKNNITLKKYLKLICEVLFYNILITMIFILTGYESIKDGINAFLLIRVIDSNHFTACFLMFYLIIPFLNILLNNLNQKQHRRLIEILAFLYIFLGTVPKFYVVMNYVSWFSTLYIIAAYIRLYQPKERKWGVLMLAFVVMAILSIIVCLKLGAVLGKQAAYSFVSDSNTFLAFAISICSFMYFKGLNLRKSRLINAIGGSTFGVFCIHTNSMTMINWIWKDFLNVSAKYNLPLVELVVFSFASVIGIFAVCVLFDQIRIYTVEKFFLHKIENNASYLKIKNIFEIY